MSSLPPDVERHHDTSLPPEERIRHAVDAAAARLFRMGLDAEVARETVERHRSRILAGGAGPIRVQRVAGGELYPLDPADPLGHFVGELWGYAPADAKARHEPTADEVAWKRQQVGPLF